MLTFWLFSLPAFRAWPLLHFCFNSIPPISWSYIWPFHRAYSAAVFNTLPICRRHRASALHAGLVTPMSRSSCCSWEQGRENPFLFHLQISSSSEWYPNNHFIISNYMLCLLWASCTSRPAGFSPRMFQSILRSIIYFRWTIFDIQRSIFQLPQELLCASGWLATALS